MKMQVFELFAKISHDSLSLTLKGRIISVWPICFTVVMKCLAFITLVIKCARCMHKSTAYEKQNTREVLNELHRSTETFSGEFAK
jgi:hypothetical protein